LKGESANVTNGKVVLEDDDAKTFDASSPLAERACGVGP
jgi:hypothetical protein